MKLKALKPRLHNIMFHTHTVSGIVISFALFIIFYAGSIALFRHELYQWENPDARIASVNEKTIDYDKVFNKAIENVPNIDFNKRISIRPFSHERPLLLVSGEIKTTGKRKRFRCYVNPKTYEIEVLQKNKTHMANTIYQLHYFRQLPVIGRYLSGLVALFMIFAVFTGVLTHWKNITNKFYGLTTKGKWKQIWTNSHISLGFLTIPVQLIYGITGGLLCLSTILLGPSAYLLFNGDTNEIVKMVSPGASIKYDKEAKSIEGTGSFNKAFTNVFNHYPETHPTFMVSNNYGKEDGTITVFVNDFKTLKGKETYIYSYKDGSLLHGKNPQDNSYTEATYASLIKLHYATYGGLFLKIIYFILAMVTCYMIMSGVMIWQTARDNKKYTDKQRKFHFWVTKSYLAATLSLFPSIGLIFLLNKLIPLTTINRTFYVDTFFFIGWLVFIIIGLFWKSFNAIHKNYLLIGSIFGLFIPVANGIVTGDWFWKTFANQQYYVFCVDFTWLCIGISGFIIHKSIRNINNPKK